jgi:hypothetical protein
VKLGGPFAQVVIADMNWQATSSQPDQSVRQCVQP